MSRISCINEAIHENFKINNKEGTENNYKIEVNNEGDGSFDQLLSLQLLIQRHSGLKELCKFILTFLFYIILLLFYIYSHKRKR